MAFFEAYFDESGTHGGSLFTVVGGALGTEPEWIDIDRKWSAVLNEFEVSVFRSSKLNSFEGEFKDWNEPKRRQFTNKLLDIVTGHPIRQIVACCKNETFELAKQQVPESTATPYQFCCDVCFGKITHTTKTIEGLTPVAVTFAAGQKYHSVAYEYILKRIHSPKFKELFKINKVGFADMDEAVPLQVADLIAGEYYKGLVRVEIAEKRPLRYTLQVLNEKLGIAQGGTPHLETIREFLAGMEEVKRIMKEEK